MHTLSTLGKILEANVRDAAAAKAIRLGLEHEITRIRADAGTHEAYRKEQIVKARERLLPRIRTIERETAERAALIKHELQYWKGAEGALFQMSVRRFDKDAGVDAQIRAQRRAEFAAMPEPILKLHAESARARGDLADLYMAHQASITREFEEPISIEDVVIPGQAEALGMIAATDGYAAEVQLEAAEVNGTPTSSREKLELGRRIMAGRSTAAAQIGQ